MRGIDRTAAIAIGACLELQPNARLVRDAELVEEPDPDAAADTARVALLAQVALGWRGQGSGSAAERARLVSDLVAVTMRQPPTERGRVLSMLLRYHEAPRVHDVSALLAALGAPSHPGRVIDVMIACGWERGMRKEVDSRVRAALGSKA